MPADTPLTLPLPSTVAIAVLLLVQLPPLTPSVKAVLALTQTVVVPLIVPASGNGLTATLVVAIAVPQLFVTVYAIFALPADTPLTLPLPSTVAIAVLLLLQLPPLTPSVKAVLALTQTVVVPLIVPALGNGLTATLVVAIAVPQLLLMV